MNSRIAILSVLAALMLLFGCSEAADKADEAVMENNPLLCKELSQSEDVERCLYIVADKMNNPEVCFQSKDRNRCITEFSMSKGNLRYCDMTTDPAAKYSCVAQVAGDTTGRAIESIIADWRSSGAVSKCKELCKPPYQTCMSGCYNAMVAEKEACAAKTDHDERYFCEYEAEKARDRCSLGCYEVQEECEAGCMPKE